MTAPETQGPTVTQADREAAAEWAKMQSRHMQAANMLRGSCDTAPLVQLMARHREAAEAASRDEVKRLREALGALIAACDRGRSVPKPGMGACGMTIEAQTRASCINGVDAWAVEEARAALTASDGEVG